LNDRYGFPFVYIETDFKIPSRMGERLDLTLLLTRIGRSSLSVVIVGHLGGVERLAICDVTSATNTRTVHATLVPENWTCGNTAPVLLFESERLSLAGLAILNSLVFDWMARRVVGGLHLNNFYLATLVWPNIDDLAIERLARLAATMAKQSSRVSPCVAKSSYFRETSGATLPAEIYAHAEAEVEQEVAKGFQLERDMLHRILSADRRDRRGFWRYFNANPLSLGALRNLLDSYGHDMTPSPVSAVA
jgi:hypothetical protein